MGHQGFSKFSTCSSQISPSSLGDQGEQKTVELGAIAVVTSFWTQRLLCGTYQQEVLNEMKRFDFSQNSKFLRVAKSFTQKDALAIFT